MMFLLLPEMQAQELSFNVWILPDETQRMAATQRLRIPPSRDVLLTPVAVQKNKTSIELAILISTAAELFDSATGHCERISSFADPYIQIDMQALAVAEHHEPFCHGLFAVPFDTDKDASAGWVSPSGHPLAEYRHSSDFTTAVSLLECRWRSLEFGRSVVSVLIRISIALMKLPISVIAFDAGGPIGAMQ